MKREEPSFAVMASGRGSNFAAILERIQEGELRARVAGLIVDRADAGAVEIAKRHKVPVASIVEKDRERWETRALETLEGWNPRYLVLAGFMRLLSARFLKRFEDAERGIFRVVNIHPSLLPAFPGTHAYRKAFESGAKRTGVTVHLVDERLDHGPVCAKEAFDISACKSAEEVEALGLKVEHRLYARTLQWLLNEDYQVESRGSSDPQTSWRVCVPQS